MNTHKLFIGTLVLFLTIGTNSLAQTHHEGSQHFTVKVIVDADDDIQALAERYILRELRLLPEVTLVEEMAEWELRFNVKVLTSIEGERLGFAMSVTAARLHNVSLFKTIFPDTTKHYLFDDLLEGSYNFVHSFLHVGPIDGLRKLCGTAVRDIDINLLEQRRKLEVKRTR